MADIFIYDEIGPDWAGMVSAQSIKKQIDAAKNEPLNVRINSPGGDVFEGVAIHNLLRNHAAGVTTHIDSLAASAASFIAMAGARIKIAENAMVMVHRAMAFTFGNVDQHNKTIGLLAKVDETIGGIYVSRTKASVTDVAKWMEDETWMTAAEALERGFADEIGTTNAIKPAGIKNGRFRHTPAALLVDELPREAERLAKESYYRSKLRLTRAAV